MIAVEAFSERDLCRCRRLAERAVATFDLNLHGLSVLTEAATGWFAFTPLIAALAGAAEVLCLTRDSRFGAGSEVTELLTRVAAAWGVSDRVRVLESRTSHEIDRADIVTNSGFVRPLDVAFLQLLKDSAVIPLMFETWECRESDIDLVECARRGIAVMGTNERDPRLRTFEYVGFVAAKLLFELGVEVLGARVLVIGFQGYADDVAGVLGRLGCEVIRISGPEWSGYVESWKKSAPGCDAIVFAEHRSQELLFGEDAGLAPAWLRASNPGVAIAHIAGNVDAAGLNAAGLQILPEFIASAGSMSANVGYLGPRPVIDLNSAGLRVGEVIARLRAVGKNGRDLEHMARQIDPVCGELVRPGPL